MGQGIPITNLEGIPSFITVGIQIMELLDFKIQIMVDMHFKILKMVVVSQVNRMVMEVELKSQMPKGIQMVKDIHMQVHIDTKEERISFEIHMEEHNCILKEH